MPQDKRLEKLLKDNISSYHHSQVKILAQAILQEYVRKDEVNKEKIIQAIMKGLGEEIPWLESDLREFAERIYEHIEALSTRKE